MRIAKPWLRKQTGTWYVQVHGRQVNLGKDKKLAFATYHKLMVQGPVSDCRIFDLVDQYWEWLQANRRETTCDRVEPVLRSFQASVSKTLRAVDLRPYHVQQWVDANWTNQTTKGDRIGTIKRLCNWAVEQGYLDLNPIARLKRPTPNVRQEYVPADLWSKVVSLATDQQFREFVFVMLATGARTTEMMRFEAKHLDGNRLVLPISDSKGRKRSRVVYFPDDAAKIVIGLAERYPLGKLFRNRRGQPWTRNSIRCRFRRIKSQLGMPGLTSTTLRHSFAHYRLTQGQDSLTVAKLMGHVDGRMLATRYGHLEDNTEYMTGAANGVGFPVAS